jgi:hypothetical protein
MNIRPDEWKKLFELRDDLEGEDRTLLRKLILYVELLEQEMTIIKKMAHKVLSKGGDQDD